MCPNNTPERKGSMPRNKPDSRSIVGGLLIVGTMLLVVFLSLWGFPYKSQLLDAKQAVDIAATDISQTNTVSTIGTQLREEVEIIRIYGTLQRILESTNALSGDVLSQLGNASLILTLKHDNGHIRTLDIRNGLNISKENLFGRICVGSIISFTVTIKDNSQGQLKSDPFYYAGGASADDIIVVESPCD